MNLQMLRRYCKQNHLTIRNIAVRIRNSGMDKNHNLTDDGPTVSDPLVHYCTSNRSVYVFVIMFLEVIFRYSVTNLVL